jgi:hypothetical protein
MLAEDEFVAARWTATGTQSGRWGTIGPTDRRATFSGVNIFRFENGRVAEIWNHRDDPASSSSSAHRSTPALLQKTDRVALGLAERVPTGARHSVTVSPWR